jgi:hypothetical protein
MKKPVGITTPKLRELYDEWYFVWREDMFSMELVRRSDGFKVKMQEGTAFFRTRSAIGLHKTNEMRDKVNFDSERVMYIGKK